jgi:hypothetical protein
MRTEDVETVAKMVALDHDKNPEKGYNEAQEHTLDHLKIVPQHCYVVEDEEKQIVAAMVLHPREEVFEIEDFHVSEVTQNVQALTLLRTKLLQYMLTVETEVLCCPYALKRLITK